MVGLFLQGLGDFFEIVDDDDDDNDDDDDDDEDDGAGEGDAEHRRCFPEDLRGGRFVL